MAKNRTNIIINDFYCTQCGMKSHSLPRRTNAQREAGHLKKLFCLVCEKETNHVEVSSVGKYRHEDFVEEFILGRFVDGNRVPLEQLLGCSKQDCEYNRGGRCWNASRSHECQYRPKDKEA